MHEGTRSARKGAWKAPIFCLLIAAASFVAYNLSPPWLANRVVFVYAATLVLGPSFVYPWARARGRSGPESVAWAFLVPAAWVAKECLHVGLYFPPPEALYYALNPLVMGLFTAAAVQIAASELLWRRFRRGRWEWAPVPVGTLLAVAVASAAYAFVARRHGVTAIFYLYIEGYRRLFGA
ncbi:MAG: hypothetical protein KatS3mg076_3124 [Candidatus Binatia bacterium]|nr:MAG: hypothetical protein KatS3mg076_3124 [Candidatus Binatia bacterium]